MIGRATSLWGATALATAMFVVYVHYVVLKGVALGGGMKRGAANLATSALHFGTVAANYARYLYRKRAGITWVGFYGWIHVLISYFSNITCPI